MTFLFATLKLVVTMRPRVAFQNACNVNFLPFRLHEIQTRNSSVKKSAKNDFFSPFSKQNTNFQTLSIKWFLRKFMRESRIFGIRQQ